MKSIPEELAYRISIMSQNPFFYLLNGIWNRTNFEKLLQQNYTFPSILRYLIYNGEKKILERLCKVYKEEIQYLPTSFQYNIQKLLNNSLKSNVIYNVHFKQPSSPQHQHENKRKSRKSFKRIPSFKFIQVDTVFQKGLLWVIRYQLQTGEYTYIKEENEKDEKAMTRLIEVIQQQFKRIKSQIADANGCIPSATEKTENPEYCFIYLYAMISSLNFKETKWHHQLLMDYHPSFIKIKMTKEVLKLFSYLNHTFECCQGQMLKLTYYTLKEWYEEIDHSKIKNQGYMDFIFDHTAYEPLILDTLNNLPLTTWRVLRRPSSPSLIDRENQGTKDNPNSFNSPSIKDPNKNLIIPSSLLPSESSLPSNQHNILYILSHNFYLGMYPSCHLFYLYDRYIEEILKFYDEDNDQIFKYYSGIASNPDEGLRGFFYYTSLILLLRSPSIHCHFVNPEEEFKINQEMGRTRRRRQVHPSFLSALNPSNPKLIFISNPLSARSLNIESLYPYINSTTTSASSSSTLPPLLPSSSSLSSSSNDNGNINNTKGKKIRVSSSFSESTSSIENLISSDLNSTANDPNKENKKSDESLDEMVSKKFSLQIPIKGEDPITFIKSSNSNQIPSQSKSSPISHSSASIVENSILQTEKSSSSSHSIENSNPIPIPIQKPKVMITVKNNLLSFTNQVREWYIHRQHALPPIETLEINSPDNKEEEEELFNSVETNHELDKKEIQILPDLLTKPKVEKETNNNYFNNNEIIKNLPSSFNTTVTTAIPDKTLSANSSHLSSTFLSEFYYYTAAKTSNFVSHVYDEDWYIRQCLPNKKKKGYWAAKIYLY